MISSLSGGGAEGVCVTIANGLAERGWEIDLVVLHLEDAVHLARLSEKVNLINLNVSQARYVFKPLQKYLRTARPNIILAFNYELTMVTVLLRLLLSLKFTLIARNINTISRNVESNTVKGKFFSFLLRVLYKRVDFIINQSYGMQKDLLNYIPSMKEKCTVIHNPVAPKYQVAPDNFIEKNCENSDYILCVGRLEQQKAFHRAIVAFSEITAEFPELRLKLVGKGSLENELKLQAQQLGVKNQVDFEGFQQELLPFYTNARVTLLTSLYEGFPNTLIESISVGTPVVSVDCQSGPSEIIQQRVNGLLVCEDESVAFALRSILKGECCTDLSEIRDTAVAFTESVVIQKYINILSAEI